MNTIWRRTEKSLLNFKNQLIFINTHKYCTKPENDLGDFEQKVLTVAVIGVPNAGKSTFINGLTNHRICPISSKVHTTRKQQKAIYTHKNVQLVLFDTPGLVTEKEIKKHRLEKSFSSSYKHSIQNASMIAVVHDISNSFTRHQLHPTVLNTLQIYEKLPSFLVMNKVDTLKSKRVLLDLVRVLTNNTLSLSRKIPKPKGMRETDDDTNSGKQTGYSNFSDIFMVSSIMGDGLHDVMNYMCKQAKPGKWEYPDSVHTDDTPEDVIVNSVKARLLDYLPQEIPYNLKTQIEYFSTEKNILYASVQITCPSPRIERLICGEANGKLRQITERITSDLVETFHQPVSLTLVTSAQNKEKMRS